jgi:hypothetical protein
MLEANNAVPTNGHERDLPARKKTLPVILIRRTESRPMVNMPQRYNKMIAISRGGIVRVGRIASFAGRTVHAHAGVWMGQCER